MDGRGAAGKENSHPRTQTCFLCRCQSPSLWALERKKKGKGRGERERIRVSLSQPGRDDAKFGLYLQKSTYFVCGKSHKVLRNGSALWKDEEKHSRPLFSVTNLKKGDAAVG